MKILTEKIEQWARDRGLAHADSTKQICKLTEEVGEVARAINKSNLTDLEDGIGDCFVVLTILAMQNGLKIEDCVKSAWIEIKDRKGRTIDGMFVKESDLK